MINSKSILNILRSYFWIFIIFILSFDCLSQGDHLHFKRITNQDGLSQNWVRCIYQDDIGYIWFGTSGGLNRYNGYEFKIYSLGSVNVNSIIKKSNHELWICNDLGVYIYDYNNDSINSFLYIKNKAVLCIVEDNDKQVWFGTSTGLYKFNPRNKSLISYTYDKNNINSISNNYINSFFKDSENNLWIGTKVGLNLYHKTTNSFTRFQSSESKGALSGNDVMSICEDHDKHIWIGTAQNGVNLLTKDMKGNIQFKQIVEGYIVSLMVDCRNNLWIARSSNGGLLKLNLNNFKVNIPPVFITYKNKKLDPKSMSDNSIFCLFEDNLHDIWIGTFGNGVNYYSYRSKKFNSIEEDIDENPSIKNNLINVLLEEENYLWIGTEGGLDRYDKKTKKSKHFKYESNNTSSLVANPVYSIFKDTRGNLWVGTWTGGLALYNYQTESFKRFIPDGNPGSLSSGNVFSICEDSRNNLWIGTIGGGVNCYNYKTRKFKHYKYDSHNPKSLFFDVVHEIKLTKDGRLLIAAYGALDQYNYDTDDFTHFPINDTDTANIIKGFIISIFEDSRKNIWIATNKGLALLNKNKKIVYKYTKRHGLPSNMIQGILEDNNGNLWISTNKGLSKFIKGIAIPEKPVFINFTELDGLSNNEFKSRSVYKNKLGIMYFGSSVGYTYFHPDSILLNLTPPSIVFSEMLLLQSIPDENANYKNIKNLNSIQKIDLKYNNSDFVIKYAALNFLNSEKNKYKYKLEGYDNNWVNADNSRTATYKNLQPGKYTFKVLGSNNDGIWSNTPKSLQIEIEPPWWKTWEFDFFLVILLLSILVGFYILRFSLLTKQKNKLELKVAERTNELSEMNSLLEERQEEIIIQNSELYEHRNNLEQLIAKRTSELEIAKAKAEESDKLKTAFLHNISHEIRTPLNAIIGFSDFIKFPDLNNEKRIQYADIISKSGNQLLSIITDIINIATIEAGKDIVYETDVNLNSVLKTLFAQFESTTQLKNILLNYELFFTDENSNIVTDQIKFTQIISNLINNAIKFTKNGYVKFGYKLNHDFLEFYVEDTGIGVPIEMQQYIFDRFRQVENSFNREFGGTGLGLSISKSYVELLGGKIWLSSQPNIGTIFYFTLPYRKNSQISNIDSIPEIDSLTIKRKKTILVAEDEDNNFALIEVLLHHFNITIIRAINGHDAVEKCKSNQIDLILMDIKMPIMDGYEATRQIRFFMNEIPIIAQTAYANEKDKLKVMENGFTDYISKPIGIKLFNKLIQKYL